MSMESTNFTPLGDHQTGYEGGITGTGLDGSTGFHALRFSAELGIPNLGDSVPEGRRPVPQPVEQDPMNDLEHQLRPEYYPAATDAAVPMPEAYVQTLSAEPSQARYGDMSSLARQIEQFTIPISTTIPSIYGTEVVGDRRDEVVKALLDRFAGVEAAYKQTTTVEERATFFESFLNFEKQRIELWDSHRFTAAQDIHFFMHTFRPALELYLVESKMAYQYVKNGKCDKPVVAVLWRSPIPCAPTKKSAEGPWIFKLFFAPDQQPDLSRPPTVLTRGITSSYELRFAVDAGVASGSASARQSTPGVSCGPTSYDPKTATYTITSLSFGTSSNGRPFQVEFKLMVYLTGGKSHTCLLSSLPITTVSNVNQWKHGEGRYVAWYAFGEDRGPNDDCSLASFQNALQYSHLTSTRQILGNQAMEKLLKAYNLGVAHFKSPKTKPDSERSATVAKDIKLYQSYDDFDRVQRLLEPAEIQSVFATKEKLTGRGQSQQRLQRVEYEAFSKTWNNWWGEFAYSFYVGQLPGSEPRKLFLDGLIHVIPPGTPTSRLSHLIDPARHPAGTTIIRTSSKPGEFTYSAVVVTNGVLTVQHNRIQAPGNDYVTALYKEAAITTIINVSGVIIDKMAIVNKYREVETVDKDDYVRQLAHQFAGSLTPWDELSSESHSQFSSMPSTPYSHTTSYMDASSSMEQ